MVKRKQLSNKESDDSDSDVSFVNVDFDFFNPNPDIDYHAINRLLVQLFQGDSDAFHLHELTELILSQPAVGTTIKTDGKDTDPYALLTILNIHVHHQHPSISALSNYLLEKSKQNPACHQLLQQLLSQTDHHVGLVICERLFNMPVQTIPPMYRMLREELEWAVGEKEPFAFSHLIFVSRTYHLTPEEESFFVTPSGPSKPPLSKKSKKVTDSADVHQNTRPMDGLYAFHPEDDCIKEFSLQTADYKFTSAVPREKESVGLDTRGRLMIVPFARFNDLVDKMLAVYQVE